MADEAERQGQAVPPPGEPVHLPGPSYLPVLTAFGVSLAVCGVVIFWPMVVAGLLIAGVSIGRWISETREEISELPLEH